MTSSPVKQYRLTDFLWWTQQQQVMKQVAILMDLDYADTNTPGWFNYRTAAAKIMLENMTEAEMAESQLKACEFAEKGFLVELQ